MKAQNTILQMIFETERLLIRKLSIADIQPFHELESNPKVIAICYRRSKDFPEEKKSLKKCNR